MPDLFALRPRGGVRDAHPPLLRPHGGVRGSDTPVASSLFQGTFGRMFRALPAAEFSDEALRTLGTAMTAEAEEDITAETDVDPEENSGIAAGYTYLGQFIDHDLTFDPMSSLMRQNDPDALVDFRTPRFDLDSLYGRGPDDQPYLYESDGKHMQLGVELEGSDDPHARDLPRHESVNGGLARALIGDPRNDENQIVSQLHSAMLRFHNVIADLNRDASFAEIQRLVRWHYQYVVLTDFLPTIVGEETLHAVLPHLKSGKSIFDDPPRLHFFKWRNDPFMPVEFSVAAYRFGHSMIRPQYRVNLTLITSDPPPPNDPMNGRKQIFDPNAIDHPELDRSLSGFRALPHQAAIDWNLFFHVRDQAPAKGVRRVQPAYKIDSSLVNPLSGLPERIASGIHSLPIRNLLRGARFGLPSGQDVAQAMGIEPLHDDQLLVGKAVTGSKNKNIVDTVNALVPKLGNEFIGKAPLWFYILSEVQTDVKSNDTPIRLGAVGGRIVAEVFVGLLLGDEHSFLSQAPEWHPAEGKNFKMRELLRLVRQHGGV